VALSEVVNTDADPFAGLARRRARVARLVFPFLTALALIVAIVLITIYTERANRRDALELTDEVIRAVENTVRREVEAFLAPADATVRLVAQAVAEDGVAGTLAADRRLERLLRRVMTDTREFASAFVGDADGDFLMVQRREDALVTKLIRASDGERVVRWLERDGAGAVVATRNDPSDAFDPATRPWFERALRADTMAWSDVYRFFTTGALGVTASIMAPVGPDLPRTVVGVDLEIDALGEFLGELDLGAGGEAVIVETDGDVIAYPPQMAPADEAGVATIASFDDAVLAEAFERFRIFRAAEDIAIIDGGRYLVSATSLATIVQRDWWALLIVPEASFVGFVEANARTSLLLSSIVVLLATGVAVLLTVQGLQSDARMVRAARSEAAVDDQTRTLEALAAVEGLDDPDRPGPLRQFAAIAADAAAARRLSVWRLNPDATALACLECFDRAQRAHTAATTLRAEHLGEAWPWLAGAAPFTVWSEDDRPDLRRLSELYLGPAGIERLDVRPVTHEGRVLGAVWLEDVDRTARSPAAAGLERLLVRLIAPRLAALRRSDPHLDAGAPAMPEAILPTAPAPTLATGLVDTVVSRRDRALLEKLRRDGGADAVMPVLFPHLAVLAVRLGADAELARVAPGERTAPLVRIVEAAQAEASRLGVRYVALCGEFLIAAEGFDATGEPATAVAAIADLALALQPACRDATGGNSTRPAFRLGIDLGPAFATAPHDMAGCLNLWGEARRMATRMAESAPATAIQVTEAVYERLARDFLLRRRGSFFVDGVGEIGSYILSGRL